MQDWDQLLRLYESRTVQFHNLQEPLYNYFIRPKASRFKPEWFDYNIYVRNCQSRRKHDLKEFPTLEKFFEYLNRHPVEKTKWLTIKKLINLKCRMTDKNRSRKKPNLVPI